MIEIKHGRDIQISQSLKKIVQYDDNFTKRIFKIPKIVDGVDISDYNFTLQVEPVNKENPPYFNLLEKQVNEADILLTWTVKLHDTKDYGKIRINIRVSDSNDKVFATYSGSFEIVKSIDTDKQGEILPPSYIEQGLDQMQGMLDNANDTRDYVDGLANEVDGNTIEVREKTQRTSLYAQQVSEDKGVIEGWKTQIEDNKDIVVEKSDNVNFKYPIIIEKSNNIDEKYPIIIEKSNNIDEKYPIILDKSNNVDSKHSEVVIKSDNVDSKYSTIIEKSDNLDDKYPVIMEKSNSVDIKYPVIVEKSDNVDTKHDEVVQLAGQVEADRQEVADNKEIVVVKAGEVADDADQVAEDTETATGAANTASQAMTDLLAMLGTDIATLTDGKLTPSQIPPLSINDVFEVSDTSEMLTLTAERGDVALVLSNGSVHDSYILAADDPTLPDNWKKLGVSYVANAGHAVTADNAENANKINNKRLVAMTESQYDVAVKDENTFYAVTPD